MHVCLRWLSQTIEDLVPQEREEGGSEGEQWGKNKCNEAETECKDKQKRERRTERERESLEKCHSHCPYFCSHFAVLVLFVAHSISSNVHSRHKQQQ